MANEKKYASLESLTNLANKIKTNFAQIGHKHLWSDIEDSPTIPSKTSQLANDSNYVTSDKAAGESLGLVMSGGNVTVSGGVITVKDDLHNHIIDNIDGLQDTLDNKVDKIDGKGLSTNDYTTPEKEKLSGIEAGANKTTIDAFLSPTSENPVQNKVVNSALSEKVSTSRMINGQALTNDIVLSASDVGADPSGTAHEKAQAMLNTAKAYTDAEIADLINSAPTTLDTLGEIANAMAENDNVVSALESAVGTKANATDLTSHVNNKTNPHEVTAAQTGALPITGGTVTGKTTFTDSINISGKVDIKYDSVNGLEFYIS